jgi:hypothetical protein
VKVFLCKLSNFAKINWYMQYRYVYHKSSSLRKYLKKKDKMPWFGSVIQYFLYGTKFIRSHFIWSLFIHSIFIQFKIYTVQNLYTVQNVYSSKFILAKKAMISLKLKESILCELFYLQRYNLIFKRQPILSVIPPLPTKWCVTKSWPRWAHRAVV